MDVDKLLKEMDAYGQGIQKGREMAIDKYDKILIELWEKLNDIEKKQDEKFCLLFDTLKILEGKISS